MTILSEAMKVNDKVSIEVSEVFRPALTQQGEGPVVMQLLIEGEWRPAEFGETFDVRSPIDGTVIARAQRAEKNDVEAAIASAREARPRFRKLAAAERMKICENAAEIMDSHFDDVVSAIVADLGKTPAQAHSEASATQERLELVREESKRSSANTSPGAGSRTPEANLRSSCANPSARSRP